MGISLIVIVIMVGICCIYINNEKNIIQSNNSIVQNSVVNNYISKYYGTWTLDKKIGTAQSDSNNRTGSTPPTKIIISNKIFEREFDGQIGRYILNPSYYKIEYIPEKLFGTNNFSGITSKEITEILANPSNTPLRVKSNILDCLGLDNTRSVLISNNTLFVITSKDGVQSFYLYTKEN